MKGPLERGAEGAEARIRAAVGCAAESTGIVLGDADTQRLLYVGLPFDRDEATHLANELVAVFLDAVSRGAPPNGALRSVLCHAMLSAALARNEGG